MLGQNFVWAIEATDNSKQYSKIYVCVAEKQGNVIHAGASVAGNFLLEEQARLRSSGISAARIWYIVILDLVFVSCWFNVIGMRKLLLGEDVKTSQLKYKNRRMAGFSDASAEVEN